MAGESTMLWNPTPSDVCLFLKDVIHMCMIYNINTDIYPPTTTMVLTEG